MCSRGAELFEAKVKKRVAARLELEKKSVELLKKQYVCVVCGGSVFLSVCISILLLSEHKKSISY